MSTYECTYKYSLHAIILAHGFLLKFARTHTLPLPPPFLLLHPALPPKCAGTVCCAGMR